MPDADAWDQLAGRYDALVRLFDRSYPAVRRALARDLSGSERVLELAAGTGQFTPELARHSDAVVATDVSSEMVTRLSAMVAASRLTNVSVRRMSAYDLDFDGGAFDAVVCANALHVMERPREALTEIRRVLCENGVLVAPTFLHGTSRGRRALSRALGVVSPFVAHTRFDLPGLVSMLEDAKLEVMSAETLPGLFPIGYVSARRTA